MDVRKVSSPKLSIRIPKPRAKAKGMSLMPHVTVPKQSIRQKKSYSKDALQEDPMKFGNFGFDLNMQGPTVVQRGSR